MHTKHKSGKTAAKLQKDLFNRVHLQQLKPLRYDDNANKHCLYFDLWLNDLRGVTGIDSGFLHILKDHSKITPLIKAECIENKVLFLLVSAYVDHFYKALIKHDGISGKGDQALLLLQAQCANLTVQDHNHYHQQPLRVSRSRAANLLLTSYTSSLSVDPSLNMWQCLC